MVPTKKTSQKGDRSYEYELRSVKPDLKGSEQNRCSFLKGSAPAPFWSIKWMLCFLEGYLKSRIGVENLENLEDE